jgi:hypothetical protein
MPLHPAPRSRGPHVVDRMSTASVPSFIVGVRDTFARAVRLLSPEVSVSITWDATRGGRYARESGETGVSCGIGSWAPGRRPALTRDHGGRCSTCRVTRGLRFGSPARDNALRRSSGVLVLTAAKWRVPEGTVLYREVVMHGIRFHLPS